MMLPKRQQIVVPANLNAGGTGILGQTISNVIDRTYPLEGIIVHVDIGMGGTGLTPTGVDQIYSILLNGTLNINDGVQPRAQFNTSGMAALERLAGGVGGGLDADTRETIAAAGSLTASKNYRLNYYFPIVHPGFDEPLRSRALLPCHNWTQDQTLVLTFNTAANMYSAGTISNIYVSYTLIQRIITPALNSAILGSGGFLQSDIIETPFAIPLGQGGQVNLNIPLPGSYCELFMRQYLGGASVTRDEISANSQTTAFGNETIWSIVSGTTTYHNFRMKDLLTMNGLRDFYPRANQTYGPRLGAPLGTNNLFQNAASVCFDFLSDGTGGGDGVAELGSVLNCNLANASGLTMQLQGNVANVATNASILYLSGYRLYGNLSAYQVVK